MYFLQEKKFYLQEAQRRKVDQVPRKIITSFAKSYTLPTNSKLIIITMRNNTYGRCIKEGGEAIYYKAISPTDL